MATRDEYLPSLVQFFRVVDEKLNLPKNVQKAHWNSMSDVALLERIGQELLELTEACMLLDYENAINECADVAAFAMMLADNIRKRLETWPRA